MNGVWFHNRRASGNDPGGVTVSRSKELPAGDFGITEYFWGDTSLWFVDDDNFTDDERQAAYERHVTRNMLHA
jgi:hypothetical protein